MREIEFRGKRLRDGKWITGHGFCTDTPLTFSSVDVYSDSEFDFYEVYPETISQYTGLRDKNDMKIFEGDIVMYHGTDGNKNVVCVVKYVYCTFIFEEIKTFNPYEPHDAYKQAEVIGNIHDNPELMEEKNNA